MTPALFAVQASLEATRPARLFRWRESGLKGLYIVCYHNIHAQGSLSEWEAAYTRISTRADFFADHLRWLKQDFDLISTSQALALSPSDLGRGRYACLHFDDGYAPLVPNAAPLVAAEGVLPALFVNGDFARGEGVYYRVLAAVMAKRGQSAALAERLRAAGIPLERDVAAFDALKNHYRAGETEAWVAEAWASANPAEAYPPAHLSLSDLGDLAQAGWELGNHTLSHATLAALDADGHAAQIEGNESLLRGAGLPLQPWLAIPNGWAKHVNQHTADWLNAHPDYHAFFGTGGVNLRPSRAAWRRIAIADWDLPTFRRALQREASRTRRVNA